METQDQSKATARPWSSDGHVIMSVDRRDIAVCQLDAGSEVARANASVIVAAVNAHEALRTGLRQLNAAINGYIHMDSAKALHNLRVAQSAVAGLIAEEGEA